MRNTVLYIAMSLDGYIADKSGGVGWLSGDGSDSENNGSFPAFYKTVDTVILGYKTYYQVKYELFPANWIYSGKKSYVITHNQEDSTDDIIFTNKHPSDLIGELKNQIGKDIWICGGAAIVNQLLDAQLLDRIHVTVIPTVLGGGIRLFDMHNLEYKLRLISTETYNGMVDLVYEPRN